MAMTPHSSNQPQTHKDASSTGEAVRETAAKIGSDAKQEAVHQAEEAQRKTSQSMHAFAEAIRRAGDDLASKDEGPAAQLLGEAAGGLEQLSTALGQKRLEEIVGDVRRFGRQHPGAFMAGSVLVGIALGRLAQSTASGGIQTGHGVESARGRSEPQNTRGGNNGS